MKDESVLIVGCGYVGRRAAAAWLAAGRRVAALTRATSHADELRDAGIDPVIGDVTRPDSLADLPAAGTVLYAVGFDRNTGPSMREVYVDGLRNVLSKLAGRVGRLIYISSTSVYGQQDGEAVDEESPCEPTRENGRICLDAENVVREFGEQDQCRVNVLRLAGIYGPGRLLRRIEAVKSAEPIGGNPEAWLNLIHVDDAVGAVLACEANGRDGRTYLVSDNTPVKRRVYYERLAALVDGDPPRFDSESTEENRGKRCRNARLREELRATLKYPSINEGLPQSLRSGNQAAGS